MRIIPLLGSVCLVGAAFAQGAIVSPVGTATVEGNANNVFPFGQNVARRYLQIHADLGSTPLVITKLAFRVNASATNYAGTRVHDLELYMGDGVSQTTPNLVFDNNYVGAKTLVMPRGNVTWGPQGQAVTPGPNPFNGSMDLLLTTPFVYAATAPLVWEAVYYGNTTSGTMSAFDADSSTTTSAVSTITGTGCIATGQTAAMTHTYAIADVAGTLMMNPTIAAGPANSLAILAVGFSNPNLAFPGLCSNVYTDAVFTQVLGFTTATGTFTNDTPNGAIIVPNTLTGLPIFTQAFVVDTGSTNPIQFACSNGRSATVPAVGSAHVNQVTRLWNTVGGTTATQAFYSTATVGYSLATELSHL